MGEGHAIVLGIPDLAVAALLVAVPGLISFALSLGLEKRLLWASVRTVAQLMLIGFVLGWVFGLEAAAAVVGLGLIMTWVAGRAAVERSSRFFKGIHHRAYASLVVSAFVTTAMVTAVIVGVDPWYEARYVIPILGMVLGNSLTGLSLCVDTLLEAFSERRREVEMELALGATKWEAARPALREAVRRGMIPIINSMMVVGLVSLPGMMTGQIIEGADPMNAVRYQIVVMFMIAASTSIACILMTLLVYRRLFNARHQLLSHLIKKRLN